MSDERLTALVLAADDDEDILMLVQMVLEEDGYEVETAPNGKKALKMALELKPDICVFDVMMPKMDGCELTEQIRASEEIKDVPILLLSARTQWEAVQRGKAAGADEYVTKPFVPEELSRSVRSLLAAPRPPVPEPVLGLMEGGEEPVPPPSGLVLVAAADVNLVKLVGYRLELGGYEVATAHDASEMAQMTSERRPDLCLLDGSMPEPAGLSVMRIAPGVSVQELFGQVEMTLTAASNGNGNGGGNGTGDTGADGAEGQQTAWA